MAQKWYVVHTYSGFERKVKNALEERARSRGMEEFITEVLVPTEQVEEMIKGQRRISHRKFYPGYVLVRMELNDDSWHLVKDTPKSRVFLAGARNRWPFPMPKLKKSLPRLRKGL